MLTSIAEAISLNSSTKTVCLIIECLDDCPLRSSLDISMFEYLLHGKGGPVFFIRNIKKIHLVNLRELIHLLQIAGLEALQFCVGWTRCLILPF